MGTLEPRNDVDCLQARRLEGYLNLGTLEPRNYRDCLQRFNLAGVGWSVWADPWGSMVKSSSRGAVYLKSRELYASIQNE